MDLTVLPDVSGRQFLLISIVVILVIALMRKRAKNINNPPTLWNLPVVGSLLWILWKIYWSGLPVYELLRRLKYTYGNVYSLNIFGQLVVIVNDFESINKAFNNPYLNDRPRMTELAKKGGGFHGIVLASGQEWNQQRRFTQSTLRSFGVGKNTFDSNIAIESHELIKQMELFQGAEFNPTCLLVNAVGNVICTVVFGKRFEYSDEQFRHFQHLTTRQTELGIRYFHTTYIKLFGYFSSKGYEELLDNGRQLHNFIDHVIGEHKLDFSPEHLRDYVDVYINELRQGKECSQNLTGLTEEHLKHTVAQLFTAGTDTTALSLRWGIIYMTRYREIQEQVQREIDEVVGRNRLPMISDKSLMPYTQATIFEIQRMASTARLGLPHGCAQTTSLCGYTIPKGAIVVSNIWAIHRDPNIWTDPEVFRPERFLNQKGELQPRKELIPFSTGRRTCLGDKLARMELFIFFTHLLHNFELKESLSSKSHSNQDQNQDRNPNDFLICAIKR